MDLSKLKDLADLQQLLDLMKKHDLCEIEFESEGRKVRLRKPEPQAAREIVSYGAPVAAPAAAGVPAAAPEPVAEEPSGHAVESPLVGSFYRASSPEAEPFVAEGDRVEADTVIGIIEAMKVMNEVRAGVSGVVKDILVKNGEAVEYGQPLLRIDTE